MSDRELRAKERQWRLSRSHRDGVEYLRARLRLGLLGAARLQVAALCGLGPARELLPERPFLDKTELAKLCGVSVTTISRWTKQRGCPQADEQPGRYDTVAVMDWRARRISGFEDAQSATCLMASALFALEPEAARRATIAAVWAAVLQQEDVDAETRALVAAETRLIDRNVRRRPKLSHPKDPNRLLLHGAVSSTTQDRLSSLASGMNFAFCSMSNQAGFVGITGRQIETLCRTAFDRLMSAVHDEVVPWALGIDDPLAGRVTRRREEPGALVIPTLPAPELR